MIEKTHISLEEMGQHAAEVKYALQKMTTEEKNHTLEAVAKALVLHTDVLLRENEKDIIEAEARGMAPGMVDRLRLTKERILDMAEGISQMVALPDPIGEVLEEFSRPNGLRIVKERVPIGVIGIFYESRPNVTADAFGLCFKSGNVVILKGGSDAIHSNTAIANVIRQALFDGNIPKDVIQLIEDTSRETATRFMKMNEYVDLLIPRGGKGLIQAVLKNSTIPVIETGTGNCHIYIDEFADMEKAIPIVINAKTQRIGVCNACESLVVHEKRKQEFLPLLEKALQKVPVELRADEESGACLTHYTPAAEEDFGTEYLDYILSIKTVSSLEEAISHINRYNTHHSEAIITENPQHAEQFLKEVDAACVYVNASTRFTDGFVFGFGAEIGISTQKIHARGPMGLKELTSYKYRIYGNGQIRQ